MTKTAMITICGRPNVGKSTLTNALVGEKIAIVSPKPQTTRSRITAIVSHGDTQFVLLDTPGFHKPRTRLGDYMVNVVRESVADVDCVLLLVEPIPSVGPQEEALIERLRQAKVPALLVINKIDTVDKAGLLEVMAVYASAFDFDAILPVSAKTGDGLDELLAEMEKYAAEGPHLFPDDMITDQPERQICAELVRDEILRARKRHHRSRGHDLLREGEPQGHHHRQKGRHAQKDRGARAARYRGLHGHEGQSADLGQGQGELARLDGLAQKLRLFGSKLTFASMRGLCL